MPSKEDLYVGIHATSTGGKEVTAEFVKMSESIKSVAKSTAELDSASKRVAPTVAEISKEIAGNAKLLKRWREDARDAEVAAKNLEKANKAAAKASVDHRNAVLDQIRAFGPLGDMISGAVDGLMGPAGLAVAAGAASLALKGLWDSTSKFADELDNAEKRTGISVENLQRYKFIADQTGGSVDGLEMATKTMTAHMYAASTGSKEATKTFKELGVEITGTDGKLLEMNEALPVIITALSKMEDVTKRDALAVKLFGGHGHAFQQLRPIFAAGGAELAKLNEYLEKNNLLMSAEQVARIDKINDSWKRIGKIWQMIGVDVASSITPLVEGVIKPLERYMELGRKYGPSGKGVGQDALAMAKNRASGGWEVTVGYTQAPFVGPIPETEAQEKERLKRAEKVQKQYDAWLKFLTKKEKELEEGRYAAQQAAGEKSARLENARINKKIAAAERKSKYMADMWSAKAAGLNAVNSAAAARMKVSPVTMHDLGSDILPGRYAREFGVNEITSSQWDQLYGGQMGGAKALAGLDESLFPKYARGEGVAELSGAGEWEDLMSSQIKMSDNWEKQIGQLTSMVGLADGLAGAIKNAASGSGDMTKNIFSIIQGIVSLIPGGAVFAPLIGGVGNLVSTIQASQVTTGGVAGGNVTVQTAYGMKDLQGQIRSSTALNNRNNLAWSS